MVSSAGLPMHGSRAVLGCPCVTRGQLLVGLPMRGSPAAMSCSIVVDCSVGRRP